MPWSKILIAFLNFQRNVLCSLRSEDLKKLHFIPNEWGWRIFVSFFHPIGTQVWQWICRKDSETWPWRVIVHIELHKTCDMWFNLQMLEIFRQVFSKLYGRIQRNKYNRKMPLNCKSHVRNFCLQAIENFLLRLFSHKYGTICMSQWKGLNVDKWNFHV